MTTTIATFLLAVSVLVATGAWVAEAGVRRLRLPGRWLWLAAMAAGPLLLAGAAVTPWLVTEAARTPATFVGFVELAPIVVGPGVDVAGRLDVLFGVAWALLSVGMIALLLFTGHALRRKRAGWEPSTVLGRTVLLSGDCGPAVAGLFRPWIVLPRWVLGLPDADLGLVVLHEEEHVRAGDSGLLGLALLLVVVTPWNPITWWQLKRLRLAMEMDCDGRVLRRAPDPSRYGHSLLSIAERASGPSLGLAAFTERSNSLERRIRAMTEHNTRAHPVKAGLLLLLASIVAFQACGIALPFADETSVASEDGPAIEIPAANASAEPTVEIPAARDDATPTETPPAGATGAPRHEVTPSDPLAAAATRAPGPDAPPPPPTEPARDLSSPTFTPFTVAPSITNRQAVIDAMEESYPPLLREAGIGGSVRVYFLIGETGVVRDHRIDVSSGHPALDDAAMRVASVYRFSPALDGDQPVPVWVSFPITFQVR